MRLRPLRFWLFLGGWLILMTPLLVAAPTNAQERSVTWQSWETTIDQIDTANNVFRVREAYDLRFDGTFRFGTRAIPLDRVTSLDSVRVYQNNELLRAGCNEEPGTFCSRIEDGERQIIYYFRQPLTDTATNITVEYIVAGGLRVYEESHQLFWKAIPEDTFGFPILNARVEVIMPEGREPREGVDAVVTFGATSDVRVCFRGGNCPDVSVDEGAVVVAEATNTPLVNQEMEIGVEYPPDPAMSPPPWQSAYDAQVAFEETMGPIIDFGAIFLGFVLGVGGPLVIFVLYYQRGRDPKIGPVPEYLSEPPSNLRPAVVGTLIDEKADVRDVLSTIVDLANRGYLVIQEDREGGLFGFGQQSTFTFKRTDKQWKDLRPYEQTLLDRVFRGKQERELDELKNSFYKVIPSLQKDLYREIVINGFFKRNPNTVRNRWRGAGTVLLFGVPFVFILLVSETAVSMADWQALLVLGALLLNGFFITAIAGFMPVKTQKGAEETAKWKAFYEYLRRLEKYDELEAGAQRFADYMPYAVAFGMDKEWVRRFKHVESIHMPFWYYPTYIGGPWRGGYRAGSPVPMGDMAGGSGGFSEFGNVATAGGGGLNELSGSLSESLEAMSEGLTRMLNDTSRIITSQPQSSSGSWGSGGMGGFSGGGGGGGGSAGFG